MTGSSVTVTLSADDHHLSGGFDMQNHKYSNNDDPCHKICGVVGWCNGLVCLNSYEFTDNNLIYTFRLWNPATRKTYADPHCVLVLPAEEYASGACGFGYDNLTHAYKLVLVKFCLGSPESIEVRVCTIPQHHSWTWTKIQNFPAEAIRTHTSGIYGATDQFALWQMKEFGNENSWTLLFNLSHLDLQIDQMACYLKPMRILENGAILIIHRTFCQEQEELGRHWRSILYNGRDKTVKHAEILGNIGWIFPRQCVQSMAFFGRSN
ncbi:hypothetical protein VNO78_12191 [Psophocarpus tetragonolobus]|uniref:F-box associated domain-containing protein n=1 Tax=Psophocarpus tetragonolobus TaxID=3891 RepID=A0AAN9XPM4_PSOTE